MSKINYEDYIYRHIKTGIIVPRNIRNLYIKRIGERRDFIALFLQPYGE